MTRVISDKRGSYCHLKLDDGERILIELTLSGLKISKLRLHGLMPVKPLCDLDGPGSRATIKLLNGAEAPINHLMEMTKHKLLECSSIDEVRRFCYAIRLNQALGAISHRYVASSGEGALNTMNRGVENREHERHEIPLSSRYILVTGNNRKAPVSPIFHSIVREISLGGVSITSDNLGVEKLHFLSESLSGLATKIKMKINLPDHADPMDAVGQIVHGWILLNEKQVSLILGMQFGEFNSKHSEVLRYFLVSQSN
jgi:hypothetical protein